MSYALDDVQTDRLLSEQGDQDPDKKWCGIKWNGYVSSWKGLFSDSNQLNVDYPVRFGG